MKKVISFTILALALSLVSTSLTAVSSDLESKLLEKALAEGAVTKEQKSAVASYMNAIAVEKRKQAENYREMASVNYGGKSSTQDARTKQLKEMAKALEEEAAAYEKLAQAY